MTSSLSLALLRHIAGALSPAGQRARLLILIYHRVFAAPDPILKFVPDAAEFAMQMDTVGAVCNVLPLAEAVTRLANGTLPARAACITFDDGYVNNLTIAAPILAARGLPATFFITTDFIDGGAMWNDRVTEILRRSRAELDLESLDLGRFNLTDAPSRRAAMRTILDRIKHLDPALRLQRVAQLAERAGVDYDERLMMDERQLRDLASLGMELGAHTLTHPILTSIDEATARREIGASRERLQAILGRPVELFAYPNGRPRADYDARHVALAKSLGFQAAVSTAWGTARRGADLFQLPRIAPWDKTPTRFAARLVRSLWPNAYAVVG